MPSLNTEAVALIKNHPFAQILSSQADNSGFNELAYCPLQLLENHQLSGHLSKNNPLIESLKKAPKAKVVFTGPHGYISPRWHKEQLVPTWNYATVSLTCRVNFIDNDVEKLKAMENISHYFDPQWCFSDFHQVKNSKMVAQMLSAITVFTLDIIEVQSKFKLSQNRSLNCRAEFKTHLLQAGNYDLANIQLK
ncbi:MAG: FMN-binding negative transcriptional regulator [Colwellia sp.]|nr:FMN-binding negative transcriptional regulator [Colwellia sp.]MCW8865147.1 FMN-binding negative transcriptional regulator [Colwellia sp.]MCW9082496.1 FMN-binding negative transcriptional regulator [Colwellia sp.]